MHDTTIHTRTPASRQISWVRRMHTQIQKHRTKTKKRKKKWGKKQTKNKVNSKLYTYIRSHVYTQPVCHNINLIQSPIAVRSCVLARARAYDSSWFFASFIILFDWMRGDVISIYKNKKKKKHRYHSTHTSGHTHTLNTTEASAVNSRPRRNHFYFINLKERKTKLNSNYFARWCSVCGNVIE